MSHAGKPDAGQARHTLSVRRFRDDEWRSYREIRLRALADSPDAFGSTFESESAKPDQYWLDRLSSAATSDSQLPLVGLADDTPAGLVWGAIDPSTPDIARVFQMWVAPEARGQGLGAMLLHRVIAWAKERRAASVRLRVTCGNTAATQLYERAGFRPSGPAEPLRAGSTWLAQPMVLAFDADESGAKGQRSG